MGRVGPRMLIISTAGFSPRAIFRSRLSDEDEDDDDDDDDDVFVHEIFVLAGIKKRLSDSVFFVEGGDDTRETNSPTWNVLISEERSSKSAAYSATSTHPRMRR